MDGTDKKTSPAERLGEKAAEAYRKADPDGIVTDPDGSWTGFPRFDPPPVILGRDADPMRLGPIQLGAESVQFQNPAMEVRPVQDADDL